MNERRSVMGACEYSILALQDIKKQLLDIGSPNKDVSFAVGGIVVTLSSRLLMICQDVFKESAESGESNAKADLFDIKARFSDFIDGMVGNE